MSLPSLAISSSRFLRTDVYLPNPEDINFGAWAWRFTAKDILPNEGILSGKTIVMKNNISVAGVNCLQGTDAFASFVPPPIAGATVVTRTLDAGGTIVGKVVCENLSMAGTSFTAATGPVHNPYARGYSVGGSSSGCGALVASCAVDINDPLTLGFLWAIGGDQGGSIRLPASWCGIYGKDNIDNQIPDYPAILDKVKGTAKPLAGFKIGLKEGFSEASCEQGGMYDVRVHQKVKNAAGKWKDMGASVEDVSIPMHTLPMDLWLMIVRTGCVSSVIGGASCVSSVIGGASGRQGFTRTRWDKLPFTVKNRRGLYARVLCLSHPFTFCPSPMKLMCFLCLQSELYGKVNYDEALDRKNFQGTRPDMMNTCSFDVTGHPALSMPVGMLPSLDNPSISLQVGLQIMSKHFQESKIYKAAFAWEDKHPNWKECV
ncbi:putative amidase [Lentinula guzmanii]|uniref:Amidase n=1 Tax=Lentinula guzmanii TaxID=2804957 RepID=A0AA38JBG9_9AGAR|nr:putative amidase [Lentinula guzmanii]